MASDRGRRGTELIARPLTQDECDRAVRLVIGWAKRHEQGVVTIGELCAVLDLDLVATLRRDSERRRGTEEA